jgi:tetratricopeptide (TPR) repeat protein
MMLEREALCRYASAAVGPNLPARVRASLRPYAVVALLSGFYGSFALYLGFTTLASALFLFSFLLIPAAALTDRFVFDGKRLTRTGFLPMLWALLTGARPRLRLADIERIETHILRGIRQGGRVFLKYRTLVIGREVVYAFDSGSAGYRRMARSLFAAVSDPVLDAASVDLRDHLDDPAIVARRAANSEIPSTSVLEQAERRNRGGVRRIGQRTSPEYAARLQKIGNELRISGSLIRALEAFRRAAVAHPENAGILLDYGTCMRAVARAERDGRLDHRGMALIRLAGMRAGNDGELLSRLGERFYDIGDWKRSSSSFKRAVQLATHPFRAARGLAELALAEGKLAHVIHNFAAAAEFASTPALRRWSRREQDYFARLNSDEDYMEMEISRVNLLDAIDRIRGTSLRIGLIGIPVIFGGFLLEDGTLANFGWALSAIGSLIWSVGSVARRPFNSRIPADLEAE